MTSKSIRKWLSEFKTIGREEWSNYAAQILLDEQLIDDIYDIFDIDELSPEITDPVCHQLFDFYRSLDFGLQRFTLELVPVLLWTYLLTVGDETANDKKKYGGIEACLLGIYNIEAASRDGSVEAKTVTIPILARASVYHEPPSLTTLALTENTLMHYHADTEVSISTGPVPQVESINSQNRLAILTYVVNRYNAHIAFMSPRSHKMLCKLCSKLSKSGFDNLGSRERFSLSSGGSLSRAGGGRREVTIAEETRMPLVSSYLIELLSAVYYTIYNGNVRVGVQALEDIHFRASYELFTEVILVTNAIRNSLQFNPSGQPKDGPMGISIMLSPAQGNPVFAKDAITNASFRAKKLPEDIDVQDGAGQLDSSFHDDASEGDAFLVLKSAEPLPDKAKASPLPKVSKGPLKSIMKKKEDKTKDKAHRKESDSSGSLLVVGSGSGRKGSHFKEFLEMHNTKSPKHSVSISTGLSVSVNGDAADSGAVPQNMVRSSSGNRSMFEMAELSLTAKDSMRASSIENTSLTQDATINNGVLNSIGKMSTGHSKALNGAPVMTENVKIEDEEKEEEEEGHVFTQL